MEGHVSQVICIPWWTRVEKADCSMAKRIVDATFALGVSLRCADYLMEEDLKSYGLAPIDENDVSPLHASPNSTIVRSPSEVVPPTAAPSLSIVVPPWATAEVLTTTSTPVSPLVSGFTPKP